MDELDNPLSHPTWNPSAIAKDEVSAMRIARRRARAALIGVVGSVIVGGYAAVQHVRTIFAPKTFIAAAPSGWVFSGPPTTFKLSDSDNEVIWAQILEAHFARTEKGRIPDLDAFSTPATAAAIDNIIRRGGSDAYAVAYTVVETKVNEQSPREAEVWFRGRLTVVTKNATASSEVFVATHFVRTTGSFKNPSGWKLVGANADITRAQFYSDERDAVRREVMGLPPLENGTK